MMLRSLGLLVLVYWLSYPTNAANTKESDGSQKTPYIQNLKFSKMASFNPSMLDMSSMGGASMPNPFADKGMPGGGHPGGQSQRRKRQVPTGPGGLLDNQITRTQILSVLADIIEKQKEVARDTAEVIEVLKQIGVPGVDNAFDAINNNGVVAPYKNDISVREMQALASSSTLGPSVAPTDNNNNEETTTGKLANTNGKEAREVWTSTSQRTTNPKEIGKETLKAYLTQQLGKYNKKPETNKVNDQPTLKLAPVAAAGMVTSKTNATLTSGEEPGDQKKMETLHRMLQAVQG